MELVQGMRNARELQVLRRTLRQKRWQVLPITESISNRAMTYVEAHYLSGRLQMADALIAATCIEHGLALATGNVKHYRPVDELAIEAFLV
jgi:predicted nucleic acid-binding protein